MSKRTDRIWNKSFIVLCVISVITTFSSQSLNTVLSLYAQSLGANLSVAGTIVGMTSVASICILPFSGPMSNRIDKRFLTLISAVIVFLGTLGFALVDSVQLLMLCRFVIGIGMGISCTSTMVMVTESLPSDRIVVGVGIYGLVGIVIQSIGPATALAISGRFGYKALFLWSAAMCVVQIAITFLLPKYQTVQHEGKSRFSLKEIIAPEALLTATIGFLFAFNNGVQLAFVAAYAEASGLGGAGLYFTVQAVFTALARAFLTKVTNRHTVAFATTIAGAFLILFSLVLGVSQTLLGFYVASALFGIGYGTLLPVTQSVSITRTPEARKASGSSTYFLGIQIAFAISGTIGGWIADNYGYSVMFLSLIVPSVCAMALGLVRGRIPVSPESYVGNRRDGESKR